MYGHGQGCLMRILKMLFRTIVVGMSALRAESPGFNSQRNHILGTSEQAVNINIS